MEHAKQLVREYISLDNELTEINKKVKELRNQRNELEEKLKCFMETQGLSTINTGDEVIKMKKSKPVKNSVNKKTVISTLLEFIKDHDKVDTMVDTMFKQEEEPEETVKLARSKK